MGGKAERSRCRHGLVLWVPPQVLHLVWRERRLQDVLCSLWEHSEPPEKRVIINVWPQLFAAAVWASKIICMLLSNHLQIKCVTWDLWLSVTWFFSQRMYCLQYIFYKCNWMCSYECIILIGWSLDWHLRLLIFYNSFDMQKLWRETLISHLRVFIHEFLLNCCNVFVGKTVCKKVYFF